MDSSPTYVERSRAYHVRSIPWHDVLRQDEYQRLRADIFVKSLGWHIPVDAQGRERDRYDAQAEPHISVYGVYGRDGQTENLLGGIRVFTLPSWEHSMLMNEFAVSMFPISALRVLHARPCHNYIEITRLCVRRGRWYPSFNGFSCTVARDLTYAAAYAVAYQSGRTLAVGVADPGYLKAMRRSRFSFTEIYAAPGGTLVSIDLPETIRRIRANGDADRARRMLALCPQ